jgi:hypothetical protein
VLPLRTGHSAKAPTLPDDAVSIPAVALIETDEGGRPVFALELEEA